MSDFDETLNEEELNIITLTDEDGTDKDFEFLDLIDLDDKEYVVLLPVESEDENADDLLSYGRCPLVLRSAVPDTSEASPVLEVLQLCILSTA